VLHGKNYAEKNIYINNRLTVVTEGGLTKCTTDRRRFNEMHDEASELYIMVDSPSE